MRPRKPSAPADNLTVEVEGLTGPCGAAGCGRDQYARGLCEPHYRRRKRTGSLSEQVAIGDRPKAPCRVTGCGRTATERGCCHAHYLRERRSGELDAGVPIGRRRNRACLAENCARPAYARQLCRNHYRRLLRHGDPQVAVPIRELPGAGYVSHGYFVVPVAKTLRHLTGGDSSALEHRLVMACALGRPRGQRVTDKLQWAIEILRRYAPELLAMVSPTD
jgi:hypothetical protein